MPDRRAEPFERPLAVDALARAAGVPELGRATLKLMPDMAAGFVRSRAPWEVVSSCVR